MDKLNAHSEKGIKKLLNVQNWKSLSNALLNSQKNISQSIKDKKINISELIKDENHDKKQNNHNDNVDKSADELFQIKIVKKVKFTLEDAKNIIIETFGAVDGQPADAHKALKFLIPQWTVWKNSDFKIIIGNNFFGITSIYKIFGIKKEKYSDYLKDEAWQELLTKIFDKTKKEIEEEVMKDAVSEYNKNIIIETFGAVDGQPADAHKALEFLLWQNMNWRIHDFKVNINDKNLRFLKLNKPLKTQTKIPLRWLTEYGWYEFLSTIFGMTIDEIFIEKDIIAKNEESKYRNKIIEKYGSKDNQISSAQIALEFLLRQNREWRIFDFKLHGEKDVGLIKLLNKIFNTSYKSEYKEFGDNAWYELLASVFDVSLEKIDEIKKNLK